MENEIEMPEKEILKAIREHVKRQDEGWKFTGGREELGKEDFLKKLNGNKKFRKFVVKLVLTMTVDVLGRKPAIDREMKRSNSVRYHYKGRGERK